ncbi:50S ribosomal protein L3, partial [bacterium]|nr:50S ribosomal protein L3 [bacterium]
MVKEIIGRKLRMTQMFTEDGQVVPLTAISVGPCPITQIKTVEKDGYNAVQIGFDSKKEKNTTQPMLGHFNKSGIQPVRFLKEVRVDSVEGFELGQNWEITFEEGDKVDISGKTKGRGFQGGVKRHGWHGGRDTH